MKVKPYRNTNLINLLPNKAAVGAMLASGILASSIASCSVKDDVFQKENIELIQKNKNTNESKVYKIQDKLDKQPQIAGIVNLNQKDTPLKRVGKSLSMGLLGGVLGACVGSFRGNKSFLNKTSQCACVGAAAGVLFPSLTLAAIITGASAIVGGLAGSYFSGGNEKAGKIGAIIFALAAAGACLL